MPRPGVFVTGTDTGIGKTLVCACLVQRWDADYWKPVQTGVPAEPGDSETVAALTGARIHPPRHIFAAPLSPEAAAAREGRHIAIRDFHCPPGDTPIVVEGAGGILVPLGQGATMADLIKVLGLPAILVARGTLGTINHSLLSIEALRARGIGIAGIVVSGPDHDGNAAAIERLTGIPVLAIMPRLPAITQAAIAEAAGLLPAIPPQAWPPQAWTPQDWPPQDGPPQDWPPQDWPPATCGAP